MATTVPFPKILKRVLGMIQQRVNQEISEALLETMEALELSAEDGWKPDLQAGRFEKMTPTEEAPETSEE